MHYRNKLALQLTMKSTAVSQYCSVKEFSLLFSFSNVQVAINILAKVLII